MRTRSKIDSSNPVPSGEIEGRQSKRIVKISKTVIRGQNITDINQNMQSNDISAVYNIRKRYSSEEII